MSDDLADDDFFGPSHADECDGSPKFCVTDEVDRESWWLCRCGKRVAAPEGT